MPTILIGNDMPTTGKNKNTQTKIQLLAELLFAILGVLAIVGNWFMTEPTVAKINMVAGAIVFFGLLGIMCLTGLAQRINRLESQIDSLLKHVPQSDGGSN